MIDKRINSCFINLDLIRKGLKIIFLLLYSLSWGQELSFPLEQINGQVLIKNKLTAKGIKIGVIDGGFLNANKSESLKHLFERNSILGYRDYLTPNSKPYSGSRALDDDHGTEVLSLIAGNNFKKGIQFGLATDAKFYLARTDHGGYEKRKEEKYAIDAMEWMAKEGVKVINMSLGYTDGYTNPKENYSPGQIDGKTTILTKKIDKLSKKYGILFVVSAGNEGDKSWKIIGSPADSKSCLAVGATKYRIWDDMNYSSKGPEFLTYQKPDVSCVSSIGTSYSAPIITGLAAAFLQSDSTMTGEELKQKIIQSCNLYPHGNNYLGYGVPDAEKLITGQSNSVEIIETNKSSVLLSTSEDPIYVAIYHKQSFKVIKKQLIDPKKGSFKIKKEKGATSTTVIIANKATEIFWN